MSANEIAFFPEQVVWEITFACSMRCIHCGTSAGKRRPDELTTEEALSVIDELTELGCKAITLSGGEPLMRNDWPLLARRIKDRGLTSYLITNGYAVTEEIADKILDLDFKRVGISIDGTREVHNYIRQRPDSFDRCMNAVDTFLNKGVEFCVITQVSQINLDELDAMHDMLVARGVKAWRIQMCTVTGRMQKHGEMALTTDQFEQMVDKLLELKTRGEIFIDVGENIGYYGCKGSELNNNLPYLGCYAGVRIAGIESNGNVKGCLSMPPEFVEGNLRDSSLTEIWNNPDGFAYNRKFTKETASGACYDCRYLPLCRGGCATTSVSASGKRANNPYCMYQIEQSKGIEPPPDQRVAQLLKRFNESESVA